MTRVEQHHDLMLRIAKTRRLRGQMTTLLRNGITQTEDSQPPPIEIVATRNGIWNNEVDIGGSGSDDIIIRRSNNSSSSTTISTNSSDNRLEEMSTTINGVAPINVESVNDDNNDNVTINLSDHNIVTTTEQQQAIENLSENL